MINSDTGTIDVEIWLGPDPAPYRRASGYFCKNLYQQAYKRLLAAPESERAITAALSQRCDGVMQLLDAVYSAEGTNESTLRDKLRANIRATKTASDHRRLLREAGFEDVVDRGTPPPIVLMTPRVPPSPPITVTCRQSDSSVSPEIIEELRETMRKLITEMCRAQNLAALADPKPPIVY